MTTYKVWNGTTWVYIDSQNYDSRYVLSNVVGENDGIAPLDSSGLIPNAYLPSSITGAVNYRGPFDPTEGEPIPAAQGYYYVANGVGTIDATAFSTGDWLVYRDGVNWDKISNSSSSIPWVNVTDKPSDITNITTLLDGKATKTDSDITLYVYEDATGTGDGSTKANGFTSLQAAIDSVPDVAQTVTIIVCKGSTNYLGDTTVIQKASIKSLTIQGEYYTNESCDSNAVAGKIVDASADFSNFATGDRVVLSHYSGTVGSSSIDDYLYTTIASVDSSTQITLASSSKTPTTGWKYLINQTVFDGNNTSGILLYAQNGYTSLTGICITNCAGYATVNTTPLIITSSVIHDVSYAASATNYLHIDGCGIVNSRTNRLTVSNTRAFGRVINTVISAASAGTSSKAIIAGGDIYYPNGGTFSISYIGIFSYVTALSSRLATCSISANYVYIANTCTYGTYGYNVTLFSCSNNAITPVTNLTSGGSIDQWDGFDLPSVANAFPTQVLRLNSDKSALEFATVTGGSIATDTIWDAAGDLVVGTGSNTAARLPIGFPTQVLQVNSGGTALEFATISTGGVSTFLALTDTPDIYGYASQVVRVNSGGTALEFATVTSGGASVEYITRTIEGVVYETTLMYWVAPATCTINAAYMYLGSAPSATSSLCSVQVMKNGLLESNSIFTSTTAMSISETATPTYGLYSNNSGNSLNGTQTMAANDVLWFRVNRADTGSADLTVRVKVTYS